MKAAQLGRGQSGTLATATAGHRAALDRLRERAGVMLQDAGGEPQASRREALEDLFWAVLTGREFLFNH